MEHIGRQIEWTRNESIMTFNIQENNVPNKKVILKDKSESDKSK